jgi:signal transduction histidine kinase
MRRMGWIAAWPVGLALGVATARLARNDPSLAYAGSGVEVAIELLAGCAVIASGLIWIRRHPRGAFGMQLVAGGCGWFLLEWNNPSVGSPLVFTVGLVLYAAAPPVLAYALLSYPANALKLLGQAAIALAFAGSVLALGLLPALVFDPGAQGCGQCPRNLLLVHGSATLYRQFNRVGVYVGLAWTVLVLTLLIVRVARASFAVRRRLVPVLIPGCAYLGLIAADFVASVHRGYLANDPIDRGLWVGEAAALTLVALAPAWYWLSARRTRTKLARLVVELSNAPSPGGLEQALARSLGDPGVRLASRIGDGRYVDAEGRKVDLGPDRTALLRERVEVAVLSHKPGFLDDPGLVEALTATVRLALDNERLRAELLAHLTDLRDSRARIVATGDQERRRLERDLHDGAQQRLVALVLALGLLSARLQAGPGSDQTLLLCMREADRELRAALDDLRVLASGIFPSVLGDEGLAAAVEALAEEEPGRIRIQDLPEQRLRPAIESAAYRVIADTVKHALHAPVSVDARVSDGLLVVEIQSDQPPDGRTDLEDRVGALGGTLALDHPTGGRATIRAEIPCAS